MAAPMAASTRSTTNAMVNILPVDERRGAVGGGGGLRLLAPGRERELLQLLHVVLEVPNEHLLEQ